MENGEGEMKGVEEGIRKAGRGIEVWGRGEKVVGEACMEAGKVNGEKKHDGEPWRGEKMGYEA